MGDEMRKIATLALAAALSIAALAPAAFASQGDCTGKDFAASMKVAAQTRASRAPEKNAWASDELRWHRRGSARRIMTCVASSAAPSRRLGSRLGPTSVGPNSLSLF